MPGRDAGCRTGLVQVRHVNESRSSLFPSLLPIFLPTYLPTFLPPSYLPTYLPLASLLPSFFPYLSTYPHNQVFTISQPYLISNLTPVPYPPSGHLNSSAF